jgi:hypothetical protein
MYPPRDWVYTLDKVYAFTLLARSLPNRGDPNIMVTTIGVSRKLAAEAVTMCAVAVNAGTKIMDAWMYPEPKEMR